VDNSGSSEINLTKGFSGTSSTASVIQLARTGMCKKRSLVVHIDKYTVLFAFTIKLANFAQICSLIYLLLKKKKHSSLDA
jgi:hypothetical protein